MNKYTKKEISIILDIPIRYISALKYFIIKGENILFIDITIRFLISSPFLEKISNKYLLIPTINNTMVIKIWLDKKYLTKLG